MKQVFPPTPGRGWGGGPRPAHLRNTVSGKVQLRLLESGLSVSTLGGAEGAPGADAEHREAEGRGGRGLQSAARFRL